MQQPFNTLYGAAQRPPQRPALQGAQSADGYTIGAGYTVLSAALIRLELMNSSSVTFVVCEWVLWVLA